MEPTTPADEMRRTTVLKTVILPLPPREIIALGRRFFTEQGYRAMPAGTPNSLMLRGGREGHLPSVIGEVSVQDRQGIRGRTSVVSLSGYGERLGPTIIAFYDVLRAERQRARTASGPASAAPETADDPDDGDEAGDPDASR